MYWEERVMWFKGETNWMQGGKIQVFPLQTVMSPGFLKRSHFLPPETHSGLATVAFVRLTLAQVRPEIYASPIR